jgi:hypothetical protein
MNFSTQPSRRRERLVITLRLMGLLDLCAFAAAAAPRAWIAASHERLGLGTFPFEPIAGYLARCTSIWCGLYGLLLWFVASDVDRYARLINLMAITMLLHGIALVMIDWVEGMPMWWTATEGPCCSVLALVLLLMLRSYTTDRRVEQNG